MINHFEWGKLTGIERHTEELDNTICTICGTREKMMNRLFFADGNAEITCDDCRTDFERIQHLI